MTTKKVIRNFGGEKPLFFRKRWIFSWKSLIFSQNVSQIHRNFTWDFLGFFSGPSRVFDFFRVVTLVAGLRPSTGRVKTRAVETHFKKPRFLGFFKILKS